MEIFLMLTDIFADRYANATVAYTSFQSVTRFMVQASRMITEQIFPLYDGDGEDSENSKILKQIHYDLSLELGLEQLTAPSDYSGRLSIRNQTANFFRPNFREEEDFDAFLKERLSFIELAFRTFEGTTRTRNAKLLESHTSLTGNKELMRLGETMGIPVLQEGYAVSLIKMNSQKLQQNLDELRERIRKAGLPLTYSNGFLQFDDDQLVSDTVKTPFWQLVTDPKWKSVEHDMLVAVDLRDTFRPGAAASAAKALESTIKIISGEKGWNTGNEKGAGNYIDHLKSHKNGRFIEVWEGEMIQKFFSDVRNKLQHGTGSEPVIVLTRQQDDWAIETCMSWIKSLINRL